MSISEEPAGQSPTPRGRTSSTHRGHRRGRVREEELPPGGSASAARLQRILAGEDPVRRARRGVPESSTPSRGVAGTDAADSVQTEVPTEALPLVSGHRAGAETPGASGRVAGSALETHDDAPSGPAGSDSRYELVLRLARHGDQTLWYARLREGQDRGEAAAADLREGVGPDAGAQDACHGGGLTGEVGGQAPDRVLGPVSTGTGRSRSPRRRPDVPSTHQDAVLEYTESARRRLASERMVRVYAPPRQGTADPESLAQAAREWARDVNAHVGEIRHPHLLHTYAADARDPLSPLLVTEFPEGGSLSEVLAARRRVEVAECAAVVAHISRAVAWLHSQELAHGDIGAHAIFFTRGSQALLAPPWSGPWEEPPHEESEDVLADDVRDLAATVWQMLTGQEPGDAEQRVPLPLMCPGAGATLVRLLEDALSPDPATRPSIQEFLQVFRGASSTRPVDLHPSARQEFAGRLPSLGQAGTGSHRARVRGAGRADGTGVSGALPPGGGTGHIGAPRSTLVFDAESGRTHRVARGRDAAAGGHRNVSRGAEETSSRLPWRRKGRAVDPAGGPRAMRVQGARMARRWVWAAGAVVVLVLIGGTAYHVLPQAHEEIPAAEQPGGQTGSTRTPTPPDGRSTASGGTAGEGDPASMEGLGMPEGAEAADPRAALAALIDARDQALRTGEAEAIASYAVPEGALEEEDQELLRRLAQSEADWSGLRSRLSNLELEGEPGPVEQDGSEAVVSGRLTATGYRTGDAAGSPSPGTASQDIQARLRAEGGRWRIQEVLTR